MDGRFDDIITGDEEKAASALQEFVQSAAQTYDFPELSKSDKRKRTWEALYKIANTTKDKQTLTNCFLAIRILSREKIELNELITNEWFDLIKIHSGLNDENYVFDKENLFLALEALKCLWNLIFNSPVAAGMCCTNGTLQKLAERLKVCKDNHVPNEILHFDVRLIFLITGLCGEVRLKVKDDMKGLTSLIHLLDAVLKEAAEECLPNIIVLSDQKVDLVCDILKTIFNLTTNSYGRNDYEEEQCIQLVKSLYMYLLMPTTNTEKTLLLHNNIINLLTNMPGHTYKNLMTPIQAGQTILNKCEFEGHNMTAFYEILNFLYANLSDEQGLSKQKQGDALIPVLTVLIKSAITERIVRKYLRSQILPPLKDVHNRPEEGNTLRNHLCRLLTSPSVQLKYLVAEFLFILCKKNVQRMIKYTGYGNAAGLFAQRGLLGGKSDEEEAEFSSDGEDSETEEYAKYKHAINPVTGCYEAPHPNPMENMTEEQKEYEAMKLVELLDNMTRSGVIKPCRVGKDGKPQIIQHVLELQQGLKVQTNQDDSDND